MSNVGLEFNLLISNLCKLFEVKGFARLELPLVVNGAIRRDLTSAMLILPIAGVRALYKHGTVLRPERHCDLGRFKQFVQFDFDVFGLCCLLNDVCVICYVYNVMRLLDVARLVKCALNVKRVLLGFSEVLGVLRYSVKRRALLRVLDKSATLVLKDMLSLLSAGRFDVSGAFVPGLGMSFSFVSNKLNAVYARPRSECHFSNFRVNSAFLTLRSSRLGEFGVRELVFYNIELLAYGLLERFVILNPLLNRGLAYYTGAVFEVLSEVVLTSERNVFVKIGSLVGGGRFDSYIGKTFAVGCSLGVSRVLTFLGCVKREFVARTLRHVCICVNSCEGLNSVQLSLLRELIKNDFSVKILYGLSFAAALKLARKSVALLFRASSG